MESSGKQAKTQESILAWSCSNNTNVVVTFYDLHGLNTDQWTTLWEFLLPYSDELQEQAVLIIFRTCLYTCPNTQTMCNHTERCNISNYYGTSLIHNEAEEPSGKKTNYLSLFSFAIVYSSSLSTYWKNNFKMYNSRFSDILKIYYPSGRLLILVICALNYCIKV